MSLYERWILPHVIRLACGTKPIRMQREKVVPHAEGRVLEIGIGGGANLPYYDQKKVTSVTGVDPSAELRRYAEREAAKVPFPVDFVGLSGEEIPVENGSFDTVVTTYTLCTIPDPIRAVREMKRALRPGGRLVFSEHGIAPDEGVRRWQKRLNGVWGKIGGGCNLDRDIPGLIRAGGFDLAAVDATYVPGPKFASFHYWGSAG